MNQGSDTLRSKLFRNLFGRKRSRRSARHAKPGRRFEALESRLMLHGGEDHGINGPHDNDPNYSLSNFHIHAQLAIYVDGQQVAIPQFGGVSGGDSIHTHDGTGRIHIHPTAARTSFVKLGEVFNAWKNAPQNANPNANLTSTNLLGNLVDNEHQIQMFVNGTQVKALQDYQIHDEDSIVLAYTSNPIVTINTNLGQIPVELFRDKTPITVNNFLKYINDGDYLNSFFHRFVPNFVMQGGGFKSTTNAFTDPTTANNFTSVATDPAIQNEFDNWVKVAGTTASITTGSKVINLGANVDLSKVVVGDRIRLNGRTGGLAGSNMFDITAVDDASNTVTVVTSQDPGTTGTVTWAIFPKVNVTGTLAMAKVGNNPNSATSQFFINLVNNDTNLDLQNGGFTVFGQILDETLLTRIAALNNLSLFSANLTGGQEVPPVTTTASGSANLALNKRNNQFDLTLNVQGITQNNLTASHIHTGAIGQEGNSFFDLGAGAQYTTVGNQLRRTVNNGAFPAASVNDLQLNRTYLNVHSTAHSDGEVRGQLTPLQGGLYSDLPTTTTDELIVMQSFTGEGEVRGNVFLDSDNDGVKDQNETGRQGFTIFADANNNSQFDANERSAVTDASGNYVLRLPAGSHKLRMVPTSGVTQTLPNGAYDVSVQIGGQLAGRDFGTFSLPTPTGLDLLDASDTGTSNTDNHTRLNNSSAQTTMQIRVTGVVDGALVRVRSDGTLIGEATVPAGSNGTIVITTNGTTTIADGTHNLTATQTLGNATSTATSPLSVSIDSAIANFTSTPPTTATIGTAFSYNAEHPEESQAGFSYALRNAPAGATVSSNGTVTWTPTAAQTGTHNFEVVATDRAGNERTQPLSIVAGKTPQVRFRLVTTDANGNPITSINIGSTFQLRAFVQDVRANVSPNSRGVFSAYHDVTFNGALATASNITHDTTVFGNSSSGAIAQGSLDEVGSFSARLTPPGSAEFPLYIVTMTATRSGTLTFTGDAPDALPSHAIGVHGNDASVPLDEVDFGRTSITIVNPDFQTGNDTFNFDEDTSNNTLNVLTNDQGRPGTTLSIVGVGTTNKGGTVAINTGNQTLRYTPAANFFGEETFTYTVSDGSDESVATVTVQVHPVNDPPVAVNDTFTVNEDGQNVVLAVLQNDKTDPDGPNEKLKVISVTQPANGTITIENTGLVVRYTPRANFFGTDTFTYTIEDDGNPKLTATATATITVTPLNDPPTATADKFTINEDSPLQTFDVLANDSFAPDVNETLTITAVTQGSKGSTVALAQNGTRVNFTPKANVFGDETFTYTISDGNGGTATGTVTVTMTAVNDPPNAVDDTVTAAKNSQNNVINVLGNDTSEPDATETLVISAVTQGNQNGTVTIVENGTRIRYVPAANFLGTETFTYTIRDPGGLTDTATVTVTVRDFKPSSLSGFVYIDADNDGVKDTGEAPLTNVQIALTGTDNFGGAVSVTATTDANGAYSFTNLAPGNYKVKQTQPTGQHNNQPIVDGKDTVGSQGGTVSANDEFTITLNEDVTGINNNFGEITGFKVSGRVFTDTNGQSQSFGVSGVQMELFAVNAQNQATGSALKTTTVKADGTFTFEGVPVGSYVVKATAPVFLQMNNPQQNITVSNGDLTNGVNLQVTRAAKYITFRDYLNSTPRQGVFAAVNVTARTGAWAAVDNHWPGFSQIEVKPTSDGARLRIEVTRTTGERLFDEIPINDRRVHTIATEGAHRLYRLQGPSTNYNLRPVTTTNGAAGEGEGESSFTTFAAASSHGAPTHATSATPSMPILVTSGVLDSSAESLGENNGISSAPAGTTTPDQPSDLIFSLNTHDVGHTSLDTTSSDDSQLIDEAMSDLANETHLDHVHVDSTLHDHHHHHHHGEGESDELSALDEALLESLEHDLVDML